MLPLLGQKNRRKSVAFIWGVAFINPKKKLKRMLLFGVLPLLECCSYLGVPLFWALFGDFGDFGENGVQSWPPRESKAAE